MNVALYDVDSKIPNLALMKLARFHNERGDNVEPFFPLAMPTYDKIYASKIFDFSHSPYLDPDQMEIGGTGVDIFKPLPPGIEALKPDYSLYPDFKGNIGFSMRGCRRRCEFCVVPRKEGRPVSVSPIKDLIVQDSDFLMLLDNDFFGNPEWAERLDEIRALDLRVNFNQGLNIRTINDEQAKALATVKFKNTKGTSKQVTFAWDNPKDERLIMRGLKRCKAAGIKPWMMQFYVLIGFDSTPEQDLHRVHTILEWGADPFVMPFNKTQPYQRAFARWVNGRICKTVPWQDYRHGAWKGAA